MVTVFTNWNSYLIQYFSFFLSFFLNSQIFKYYMNKKQRPVLPTILTLKWTLVTNLIFLKNEKLPKKKNFVSYSNKANSSPVALKGRRFGPIPDTWSVLKRKYRKCLSNFSLIRCIFLIPTWEKKVLYRIRFERKDG